MTIVCLSKRANSRKIKRHMRLRVYVDGLSRNVKLQYSYLDLFSGRCSQVVGREYFARNTSKGSALFLSGDNYTGNRIGGTLI